MAPVIRRVLFTSHHTTTTTRTNNFLHNTYTRKILTYCAALLVLLCHMSLVVDSAYVFDAYRLIQFDRQGQALGSRRTLVNHLAATAQFQSPLSDLQSSASTTEQGRTLNSDENISSSSSSSTTTTTSTDDDESTSESQSASSSTQTTNSADSATINNNGTITNDYARNMVIVNMKDLSAERVEELVHNRRAASILIVLPPDLSSLTTEDYARWSALEQYFLTHEFPIPVYFCFDADHVHTIFDSLLSPSATKSSDRYHMVVTTPEAALVSTVTAYNYQGWQHSSSNINADEAQPTIGIFASYDSFSVAPELANGLDYNGASVIALLELARFFSRLYSEFRTHGSMNLLFVLTGADRMNYAGSKHWIKSVDPRVTESIQFALCLEGLAQSDQLYLHVSKPAKTAEIKQTYDTFRQTAQSMNIPFEVIHTKINVSNPIHQWQHEVIARKRIVSGTLSSHRSPSPMFSTSGLFDRKSATTNALIKRNIKYIAETVSQLVYRHSSRANTDSATKMHTGEIMSQSYAMNNHFVDAWIDFLSSQPRFAPHLNKNSEVLVALEKALQRHTTDTTKSAFPLDQEYQFYHHSTTTTMSAYQTKPVMFDVYLALFIGAYLLIFWAFFQRESVMKIFSSKK